MDTVKDYEGKEHQVDVQGLTLAHITSVYCGKAGACCCGCAGKHSYHAAKRAEASRRRGYKVTDDELNEREVVRVLSKVKRNVGLIEYMETDHMAVTIRTRTYIVYLSKAFKG